MVSGLLMRFLARLVQCSRAAISPMTALMLIPISGAIAYSVELGSWYTLQRTMQNAADSAAIAAATNNNSSGTGSTYILEAKAAARPYGFVNGVNHTTVTPTKLGTCPTGTAAGATCYQVEITTVFPTMFSRVVGFNGDTTYGSTSGQTIKALAVAKAGGLTGGTQTSACVWTLSAASNSFDSNGGPKPDMSGCSLLSNGGMNCSGHNLGADYGIAAGTSSGCGAHQVSGATMPSDPYASLASNIPTTACGDAPADNNISGSLSGPLNYCGNVKLTADVTLTSANTVMVIKNGTLDLNGKTLKTATGASATIVFSGTNSSPRSHYPMSSVNKSGTIDVQAPTSGAWSGVAIYQDPALTNRVSFTYAGNEPTWNITGLVYLPKADVQFSGAVGKSASGASCFVLIAYTVRVNGTAYIYANTSGCGAAGVTAPSVTVGGSIGREKLVL